MRLPYLFTLSLMLFLSACGNTGSDYRPIIDGPIDERYELDLSQCQEIARQRGYGNDSVKTEATAGAVTGALFGALAGSSTGDTGVGALVGAAVGGGTSAAGSSYSVIYQRQDIIKRCMSGRGYKVLEPLHYRY